MRWGRFKLALSERTHIMGILNRTPDSFSDGGMFMREEDAVRRVFEMASEGADIIDIGGESTRPGAEAVSAEVELERTIPVIKKTAGKIDIPISIDTSKPEVAEEALKNGAALINDVTGLKGSPRMAEVAAGFDVPLVIMHMRGTPRTMQINPRYGSLIDDIIEELKRSIGAAVRAGLDEKKIIVDPGIGFGKTTEHNLKILNELESFNVLGRPILVGVSRKSYIANTLKGRDIPERDIEKSGRMMGTASSCALAASKGASILRVHDVREMAEATAIAEAILRS